MTDTSKTLGNGVEDAMRGFWSTRPQRPHADRKVAGVAAAVGNRYAIDPTLVRVAFIVGTLFGGSGLVAYLLGWLFLANEGDEVSAFESMINRGQSSVSSGFSVLLCLALIPTTSGLLGGGFLFGNGLTGALGFAALIIGIYLLHRGRANLGIVGQPPAAPAAESTGGGLSQVLGQMFNQQASPTTGQAPPSWDPLGAAPFAWDLPEPNQPPPPPPEPEKRPPKVRRNSKAGVTGFLTALAALIVCLIVAPTTSWLTPAHIVGVVLATLALSMIAGSLRGGGRGLIGLAIILSVGGLAITSAGGVDLTGPKGHQEYAPTSIAQIQQQGYSSSFGNLTLDLTKLPNTGTVHTTVNHEFGETTVILPATADVTVRCNSSFGNADCLGHGGSGVDSHVGPFTDDGTDNKGGLVVDLTATNKFGKLEVIRG